MTTTRRILPALDLADVQHSPDCPRDPTKIETITVRVTYLQCRSCTGSDLADAIDLAALAALEDA